MPSVQFAVLGMLKLRPMTGYDIKQAYQKGPANFMPISFGQIYPALAKLGKEKMVRQDKQPGSRGSIRYFITGKGEGALREWLFSPRDPANYRELLLRLFFAAPPELTGLLGHVETFRKEEASGWTTRKLAIPGCRSGSWFSSMAFCRASAACAGQNKY